MIRAILLHLSFNMWEEADVPGEIWRKATLTLRFDEKVWAEVVEALCAAQYNMIVLDLGDGIRYASHPEIAVAGAWTPDRLKQEANRLKSRGIELIPKLNFSTCHDTWLGPWSRCVSTPAYYQVCQDLIADVCELLHPRFFHLGMDEETAEHQRRYNYVVVRQNHLFWHDLNFLCGEVERHGARPWIWSDIFWHQPEAFAAHVSRKVLQSNWYYGTDFSDSCTAVAAYRKLDALGFDQIPTCSNHSHPENARLTVEFVRRTLSPERLLGFLQTPWRPTTPEFRDRLLSAISLLP